LTGGFKTAYCAQCAWYPMNHVVTQVFENKKTVCSCITDILLHYILFTVKCF